MSFLNEKIRAVIPGNCLSFNGSTGLWMFTQDHLPHLTISAYNRSIDKVHVRSLEPFIEDRAYSGESIDTIKLAVVRKDLTCRSGDHIPIYIVDGQHRYMVMRELAIRDRDLRFNFFGEVKIVKDQSEIASIVRALQNTMTVSFKSYEGMSSRSKFNDAIRNIVLRAGESETRQCIRNIPVVTRIADGTLVSRALSKMTVAEVERRLLEIGEFYRIGYTQSSTVGRAKREVINKTHLYQLIDVNHQWMDCLAGLVPCARNTKPPMVPSPNKCRSPQTTSPKYRPLEFQVKRTVRNTVVGPPTPCH